ncbi:MAG: 3-hydroxyacyl-CoA dehydrogenase [Promethearchaeota archaeon]|nr:MAG: 3-hydroxyacyl-CoA dehydrogenase [Candidatus Lokiarchaeota archaeon]
MEPKKIAVIGAGLMGSGIGQVALMGGHEVVMVDIKQEFVDKGVSKIEEGIKKLEQKGKLGDGVSADDVMARCSKSIDNAEAVKDCDFAIEAVIEKMDIKKQVCNTIMENGPDHLIFCTNTSTMSITEIGKESAAPERVCGMHFFNPPPLMRLIEVIRSEDTSDDTFEKAMEVAESFPCLRGDRYIAPVLKDRPGFIVNRLNAPVQIYLNWCFDKAKKEGYDWAQLDADAGGKMPMPPCMLTDFVGVDTSYHVMDYYKETLSPDFEQGEVLTELYENKKFGEKSGEGFYDWGEGRGAIKEKIKNAEPAGIFDLMETFAIMLNEGCRILDEGIASGYKIIDDANMAGMNAPGPFGMGKRMPDKMIELLEGLVEKTGKEYFRPVELLTSKKFKKMRK